jgi:hypothetical protein
MIDAALDKLTNFGPVAIIAAIAIWQVFSLSNKMIDVIKNNTAALTELTVLIKTHFKTKETDDDTNQRRQFEGRFPR